MFSFTYFNKLCGQISILRNLAPFQHNMFTQVLVDVDIEEVEVDEGWLGVEYRINRNTEYDYKDREEYPGDQGQKTSVSNIIIFNKYSSKIINEWKNTTILFRIVNQNKIRKYFHVK